MSSGRSIFFIFQLCCFAIFFTCSSIRFVIFGLQKFFTFTKPIVFFGFRISDFGFMVVWSKLS